MPPTWIVSSPEPPSTIVSKVWPVREHVDLVVAAGAVDLDRLDARERDDAAGAGDVGVGDDEDVADRRADDDDRVDARAAVDEHRRVLEVVVAVVAGAAEEAREVGDLIRVVGVLLEDEERLEQEAVVAAAAVEVQHAAVVVDLEVVVLAVAEDEQVGGVAVRHVRRVGDRHAVRELERAVAGVGDRRHGADDDLVVAAAHVDDRDDGGVVREHRVGAAEEVHLDALDLAVRDHGVRDDVRLDDPDAEVAAAGRVQRDVVGLVRAEDDQVVDAEPPPVSAISTRAWLPSAIVTT